MSEADFSTVRREIFAHLPISAGGAGTFGVVELVVPPGQRLLIRTLSVTQPTRVIVGSSTQIPLAPTGQQVSVFNQPGVALLGVVGLRADVSLLGMLIPDTSRTIVGMDWVIDFNQRLMFVSQTENADFSVALSAKLMPTSYETDARMQT